MGECCTSLNRDLDSSPIMRNHMPAQASDAPAPRRAATLRAIGRPLAVAAGLLLVAGCTKKGPEIPPAEVTTLSAYGVTLDDTATPKQVAFVLLRTLADDVNAAQAGDRKTSREMIERAYNLAAVTTIENRLAAAVSRNLPEGHKKADLGEQRDAKLYEFAKQWGAITAHYVKSFDEDLAAAEARMREVASPDEKTVRIFYDVAHDPEAEDTDKATLDIELAREEVGVRSFWRIARVGFRGSRKPVATPPAPPAEDDATPETSAS